MKYLLRLSLVLLACGAFAACGEGGGSSSPLSVNTPAPSPTPTRTPLPGPIVAGQLLPPAGTIYLGAYVDTTGLTGGNTPADLIQFESELGRTLALHMYYQSFLTNWGNRSAQDDFNNSRVPIDSWNCGDTNANIAAGLQDNEIKLKADEIKTYGWPVFVRFFWDMNLPASQLSRSLCFDPHFDYTDQNTHVQTFNGAEFIAAWKHVHDIFVQEGAVNAIFVWSVDSLGVNPLNPSDNGDDHYYYPGDAYVDWVAIDAYDLNGTSFANTYAPMYSVVSGLHKPIMIAETGVPPASQASFFTGGASVLAQQFPQVKAYSYYDAVYYAVGFPENQDWRIGSSGLPSFSAFANDPYLQGTYVH